MIVRTYGNKFKFCRLYEEDVFGYLNSRPKTNHKFLNSIYLDEFKVDFLYKTAFKRLTSFSLKIKTIINKIFKKYFYSNINIEKYNKILFFFIKFFSYVKKLNFNLDIFFYFIKTLKKKIYPEEEDINEHLRKKFKNKFSFRVDIGKPKREKKKETLYSLRLLLRHKIRFFASRMSVRQFRSYVKKKRGSKYFGSYFIWFIESRIDTIFYRLNLQSSSYNTRQFIRHNGLFVNGIFINIPSFRIKFYDVITFKDKKKMYNFLLFKFFKNLIFTSIPYYYEINHRIMCMLFYFRPLNEMIFFPFNMEIQRLGGLGERF
jgi:ribosomal protein S4